MILVLAILGFSVLILGQGGYPDIPADEAAASLTGFTGTAASYLQTFFAGGTSDINLVSLCTVAAFGAIGGILSGQMRRETAYLLSVGASESPVRPAARSMQLYREGKKLGFESFEDCAAARNAEMNIGRDAGTKRRYTPEKRADLRDAKPEAIVIRTAEAGKSDSTAAGRKESSENPFADILERSDRRKDSR
jgi:hypothetical protein